MTRLKPEEILQTQIVDYVRKTCPGVMIFCSLNGVFLGGGNKSCIYMAKLKQLGLYVGEPDLRLHWKTKETPCDYADSSTLYLECKIKPNKPTQAQADCMADLSGMGFPCEVVHTLDEALEAMRQYGVPMRERRAA